MDWKNPSLILKYVSRNVVRVNSSSAGRHPSVIQHCRVPIRSRYTLEGVSCRCLSSDGFMGFTSPLFINYRNFRLVEWARIPLRLSSWLCVLLNRSLLFGTDIKSYILSFPQNINECLGFLWKEKKYLRLISVIIFLPTCCFYKAK